jgi:hypothetical protein
MTDDNTAGNNRVLLVAAAGEIHVGAHLLHAAKQLGLRVRFCDVQQAFAGPAWLRRLNWHLRARRPSRLRTFSLSVRTTCREFRPKWLLTTGFAPIEARDLIYIGELGIRRLNFLTDDPWNPAHRNPWFRRALPHYDHVFSPRRANLDDLKKAGCPLVSYLPFGYSPELHYPARPTDPVEQQSFAADLVFAGGADRDRLPYMEALIRAGFNVALYGGYWERYRATKAHGRGHADPHTLRRAIGGSKVALCLVRQANRDGHSMRTFEVAAIGGCMLVEDTDEHRDLFGAEGNAALYFRTIPELIAKTKWLLQHDTERQQIASAAHRLITGGKHKYTDRLYQMLGLPQ